MNLGDCALFDSELFMWTHLVIRSLVLVILNNVVTFKKNRVSPLKIRDVSKFTGNLVLVNLSKNVFAHL